MRFYLLTAFALWSFCLRSQDKLTETDLQRAVQHQTCDQLRDRLKQTEFTSESMMFYGAVCLYRNGDVIDAAPFFKKLYLSKGHQWALSGFWWAKCQAMMNEDSASVVLLNALPDGTLRYGMLLQPEFKRLREHNAAFRELLRRYQPGFNAWTIVLSVITCTGYGLGFLFLLGRSRFTAGEKWLSLLMFAFSLIMTSYITIWTRYVAVFPYLQNIWPFLTLMVGPCVYLYLRAIFKEELSRKEQLFHFIIPAASFFMSMPAMLTDFGIQHHLPRDIVLLGTSSTLLTCQLVYYTVRIWHFTHNEWQVDFNIRMWTRLLRYGMILYTCAFLSYFILVSTSFFNPQWDYGVSFMMSLGILVIGYMGFLQKRIFSSEPIEQFIPGLKYKSSNLTSAASEKIRQHLERLMKEQQVFKENELRLDDLASYLDINRHQLSQVINEHYGINFFEMINRYRVAHVKRLLEDPAYAHYTILQIAFESGFNNKVSFNRYFKREIGMTPSAYRTKVEAD